MEESIRLDADRICKLLKIETVRNESSLTGRIQKKARALANEYAYRASVIEEAMLDASLMTLHELRKQGRLIDPPDEETEEE